MFSARTSNRTSRTDQSCGVYLDGVHHCQHQKLRAQNRAAQRACRDRKVRYVQGLEDKIQEAEQRLGDLRGENSELIRELCKIREENLDFRDALNMTRSIQRVGSVACLNSADCDSFSRQDTPSSTSTSCACLDDYDPLETNDIPRLRSEGQLENREPLQELLLSIWRLIQSHPGVSCGTISAKAVLDRLVDRMEA